MPLSGQEMADEFNKLNEAPDKSNEPIDSQPQDQTVTPSNEQTSTTDLPVVDDSQEIKPAEVDYRAQYEQEKTAYLEAIASLQDQIKHLYEQRAAQPAVQKPEEKELTLEELNELWKKNPIEAMRRAALSDPSFRSVNQQLEHYKKLEERRTEESFQNRINAQAEECVKKYPDFKPGSAVYNAAFNYVVQNRGWLRNVALQDPKFNVAEHAYRQVAFDFLSQKSKAQEQKLVDKRAKSASVKPGATASVTPASGSAARDAASDLAEKGTPVPEAWVAGMERALARYR